MHTARYSIFVWLVHLLVHTWNILLNLNIFKIKIALLKLLFLLFNKLEYHNSSTDQYIGISFFNKKYSRKLKVSFTSFFYWTDLYFIIFLLISWSCTYNIHIIYIHSSIKQNIHLHIFSGHYYCEFHFMILIKNKFFV